MCKNKSVTQYSKAKKNSKRNSVEFGRLNKELTKIKAMRF